jgi:hypothetical protein
METSKAKPTEIIFDQFEGVDMYEEGCFDDDDDDDDEYDDDELVRAKAKEPLSTSRKATDNQKKTKNNKKKTKGRVKIKMEFIENKIRRYTTFSKRKTGIMKKAYELSTLTGTQVMLLVASETGHVYTFATKKLQPMITSDAGKNLIKACLSSTDENSDCLVVCTNGSKDDLAYQDNGELVDLDPDGSNNSRVLLSEPNVHIDQVRMVAYLIPFSKLIQ